MLDLRNGFMLDSVPYTKESAMHRLAAACVFSSIFGIASIASATNPKDLDQISAEAMRLSDLAYQEQREKKYESAADNYEQALELWQACLEISPDHGEAKSKLRFCESNYDYCLNRPLANEMSRADSLAKEGDVRAASELYWDLADRYSQIAARRDKALFRTNREHCLNKAGRIPIAHADKLREQGQLADAAKWYRLAIERYEAAHEKLGKDRFAQNLKYARHHLSHSAFEHLLENKQSAPKFELDTFDGDRLRLEDYRGKVVLVAFWASWCGYCKRDLPMLEELSQDRSRDDFVVLGLCVDKAPGWKRGSAKKAEAMAAELTFPVAWADEVTLQAYGSPDGVPYFIWIDPQGRLAGRGFDDERENLVRSKLNRILSQDD